MSPLFRNHCIGFEFNSSLTFLGLQLQCILAYVDPCHISVTKKWWEKKQYTTQELIQLLDENYCIFNPMKKLLKLLHFPLDRGLQWNRSTNDLLSVEGSRHFPRVLFQLQSQMRLMNNHEYGIVFFVTSQKPRMYLHMNVTLRNTVLKKRQENKGRTFRSSVLYLNI